ncbi:MAG: LLM class flavin-dependent oxidoreductase [SAR202 cluster bacterium]|nr:LLM class flavin-dependent oxidoreductase [SAR202 cluster bacterium]
MELGLFFDLPPRDGDSHAPTFAEALRHVDIAESCGLDSVWIAERHFQPNRSLCSAPMVLAAAVAGRTKRIKIGTAVNVLPLYNPVRLAEEVATLDNLCQGRFEFGVGRSSGEGAYKGFKVPYMESQHRFDECLDVLIKAMTTDRLTHKGAFYAFDNIAVVPRPLQKPHPPMRIAVTSPASFAWAGQRGLPIFLGLNAPSAVLKPRIESYKQAWHDAQRPGAPDVCLRLPVHVAPTTQAALDEPKDSAMNFYTKIMPAQNTPIAGLSDEENLQRVARADKHRAMTYDDVLRNHLVAGTPEGVADRLLALKEELSLSSAIADVNFGGMIPGPALDRSFRLLAEHVTPKLK